MGEQPAPQGAAWRRREVLLSVVMVLGVVALGVWTPALEWVFAVAVFAYQLAGEVLASLWH
jgi:hypothetical protein